MDTRGAIIIPMGHNRGRLPPQAGGPPIHHHVTGPGQPPGPRAKVRLAAPAGPAAPPVTTLILSTPPPATPWRQPPLPSRAEARPAPRSLIIIRSCAAASRAPCGRRPRASAPRPLTRPRSHRNRQLPGGRQDDEACPPPDQEPVRTA